MTIGPAIAKMVAFGCTMVPGRLVFEFIFPGDPEEVNGT